MLKTLSQSENEDDKQQAHLYQSKSPNKALLNEIYIKHLLKEYIELNVDKCKFITSSFTSKIIALLEEKDINGLAFLQTDTILLEINESLENKNKIIMEIYNTLLNVRKYTALSQV